MLAKKVIQIAMERCRTTIRITAFSVGFAAAVLFGHSAVLACMCPGFNPEVYPPDFEAQKRYYRQEFKGAAFTGKVSTVMKVSGEKTDIGDNILEVSVIVDRAWFGVKQREIMFRTSDNPCGTRFVPAKAYFFIPSVQDEGLYIAPCTYASYSSKHDGNYVALMERIFGRGKKFGKP